MVKKMVIAKPEWYNQRNKPFYSYGMTREDGVYFMDIILALFTGIMSYQNMITSLTALGVFLFLLMDMTIASYKPMDERAKKHYSIAMRNMAWGMIITLITVSIIFNYINIEERTTVLIMFTAVIGSLIGFITRHKLEKEN